MIERLLLTLILVAFAVVVIYVGNPWLAMFLPAAPLLWAFGFLILVTCCTGLYQWVRWVITGKQS